MGFSRKEGVERLGLALGPSSAWGFIRVLELQLYCPSLGLSREVPLGETTYPVRGGPSRHPDL